MVAITEVTTKENVTGEDLDAHIARLSGRLEGDMTRAVTASGPPPEDENTGPETNEQSPWDIDNSIAPPEEEQVAKFKAEGNEHFKAGRYDKARDSYAKATDVYDGRTGGDKEQRAVKATVCSNRAEAHLKLSEWQMALAWADTALSLQPTNSKARFRRAKALSEVGGIIEIEIALAELRRLAAENGNKVSKEEKALIDSLTAKRKELSATAQEEAKALRDAFARGGGLGLAEPTPTAAAATKKPLFKSEEDATGQPPAGFTSREVWEASRLAAEEETHEKPDVTDGGGDWSIGGELPKKQASGAGKGAAFAGMGDESALKSALETIGKQGPATAMAAFEKAEWLCKGIVRGEAKYHKFRANPSMRSALIDVDGGIDLLNAIGYVNVGPKKDTPTDDDWWVAAGDGEASSSAAAVDTAALKLNCEVALAMFDKMKRLLNADLPSGWQDEAAASLSVAEAADEAGELPPVNKRNGGEAGWGVWHQSREEVYAFVKLPDTKGHKASELVVTIAKQKLRASIKKTGVVLLDGELSGAVVPDDCDWQLSDDGCILEVTLVKGTPAKSAGRFGPLGWWPCVLTSDRIYEVAYCDAAAEYVHVDKAAAGLVDPKSVSR
jgi:tetratricopeptide (TPR) repeat protein